MRMPHHRVQLLHRVQRLHRMQRHRMQRHRGQRRQRIRRLNRRPMKRVIQRDGRVSELVVEERLVARATSRFVLGLRA